MSSSDTAQYKVALDASTRRPSTSMTPSRNSRKAVEVSIACCSDTMPVLSRAHMTGRVEGQPAERARWATSGDNALGALDEGPRLVRGNPYAQHVGPVLDLAHRF